MSPTPFILDGVIAAIVSLVILTIAWRPWSRSSAADGRWGGPAALAAGYCCNVPRILGHFPRLSPVILPDCIFYVAILVAIFGVIDGLLRPPPWLRKLMAVPVLAAALLLVLLNQLHNPESRGTAIVWFLAALAVMLVWLYVFERPAEPIDHLAQPLALLIFCLFTGVILFISTRSFIYGRLGNSMTGAVAPMVLLGLRKRFTPSSATVVLVAVLGSLLLAGKIFTELPWLNLILVCIAPIFYLLVHQNLPRHWSPTARAAISLPMLALPLLVATAVSIPDFLRSLS
ncbi:MAG TPA: hypothetical protein VH518_21900, partial [Tepidisphaeraceae bacterium]